MATSVHLPLCQSRIHSRRLPANAPHTRAGATPVHLPLHSPRPPASTPATATPLTKRLSSHPQRSPSLGRPAGAPPVHTSRGRASSDWKNTWSKMLTGSPTRTPLALVQKVSNLGARAPRMPQTRLAARRCRAPRDDGTGMRARAFACQRCVSDALGRTNGAAMSLNRSQCGGCSTEYDTPAAI